MGSPRQTSPPPSRPVKSYASNVKPSAMNKLSLIPCLAMLMVPGIIGGSDTDTEYVDPGVDSVFSPSVTATCRAGVMNIEVETNNNFLGAVHARDYRRPACTNYGQGTSSTSLKINLLADQSTDQYCGVFVNKDSDERSVAIAVRIHKTLELADDKYYMITCGRAGFQNLQNKTSLVTLELLREGRKVEQVVYGREYMLRAHISQFQYDREAGTAEARLFSMFKFPESNRVHFQCDIVICKGEKAGRHRDGCDQSVVGQCQESDC